MGLGHPLPGREGRPALEDAVRGCGVFGKEGPEEPGRATPGAPVGTLGGSQPPQPEPERGSSTVTR